MPLAFASMLGGMTTLIGTPPNLIVSGFRLETGMAAFGMFDFTPVGVAVALVGVLFLVFFGRKLVPVRERSGVEGFDAGAYLTEARVPDGATAVGMTLRGIEDAIGEAEAQVVGLIRDEVRLPGPHPARKVRPGDILVIESDPESLASALTTLGLRLEESKQDGEAPKDKKEGDKDEESTSRSLRSDEVTLGELVILPDSPLIGRSARDLGLRTRYGLNLLAVSRQGRRSTARLRSMWLKASDVLLMQGSPESIGEFANAFSCVPLAERPLRLPDKQRAITATAIMLLAVAVVAFGFAPASIAFAGGVLLSMALRTISLRIIYTAVDWPIIVLLAGLLPVAGAMSETGTADLIARTLLGLIAQGQPAIALAIILIVTMTLSDFMNNAATAAVMCPIAIGTATTLGASADPFLMAVAVGASCAFLTPIGHQNSTLILGPGGFHFTDYWRLGLPLEIIVVAIGVPTILFVWPL